MKTEQEFLECMWVGITKTEYEEQQKCAAKARNAAIIKRNILIYSVMLALYAAFALAVCLLELEASLSIAFIFSLALLIAGYFLERGSLNSNFRNGGLDHEN